MCSLNESDDEQILVGKSEEGECSDKCRKCGGDDATVTLRRVDRYCTPCFVAALAHKFRANFGRERSLRSGAKALLAHAGDLNCEVLLRLVGEALDDALSHKKLKLTPVVVHLDEGSLRRDSADRRKTVESCIFPVRIVPLRESLPKEERDSLEKIVSSVRDSTSKRDFLKNLRRRLLLRIARESGCAYVLSAEAAADLAADSLINVSLGGGAHMRCDVGFMDDRDEITILRPMRDFTSEELEAFADAKKIGRRKTVLESDGFADLQSRIGSFVSELQRDFPATVSTVLKTSSKLETETEREPDRKCVLCSSNLETVRSECSAVGAVEYSEKVSQSCGGRCDCSKERDLLEFFCYRCRLMNVSSLPASVLSEARERRSRASALEKIKDFLL